MARVVPPNVWIAAPRKGARRVLRCCYQEGIGYGAIGYGVIGYVV
jgi:hypothetical protein